MMIKPTIGPNAGKTWDFAAGCWDSDVAEEPEDESPIEPNRTHRLKAIGNGIVPGNAQVFAIAIYRLLKQLNHAKNQSHAPSSPDPATGT